MKYPYVEIKRKNDLLWPYSVFVYYGNGLGDYDNTVCQTESGAKRWAKRIIKRHYKNQDKLITKTYSPGEL